MKIPNLPQEKPINEQGQWTAAWSLWLQQLTSLLQTHLSDEGFQLPLKSTSIITQLNQANKTGTLIYDANTQQFKGNVKGQFKVIQLD
ncbi:hypothetical protein [Rickettsiella endosymbiont of Xylota segnis]|uniref:hypothetical protein n=1 Tax=Rickettsiella endosymbiont of Xylota segnis TaxID=3066238 RepID=UPI0030CA735F